MESYLLDNELLIHNNLFFGTLLVVALIEACLPLRTLDYPLRTRWRANSFLFIVNTAIERLFFPMAGLGIAYYLLERGWGLFNLIELPLLVNIALSILIIDMVNCLQHRVFHNVPWLWNLHKVHHADPDFDFTTTFRFHPLEVTLAALINLLPILVLGSAPVAVFLYMMLLVVTSFVSHVNLRLPAYLERFLGLVFVTPYLHRIHHSAFQPMTDSNYGSVFSFWDRLFNTFTPSDAMDQENAELGLSEYREEKHLGILYLLGMPFIAKPQPENDGGSTLEQPST